jgi:hypothetical protein
VSEGPTVIEKEIQKSATENAKDVGDQIIHTKKVSENPKDRDVGQYSSTGRNMILKHPFEIFDSSLLSPIVPGPKIIQHIVT